MLEIWQLESFQKQRKNRLMLFTLLLVVFSSDSGLQFERKLLLPCRWRPLLSFTQDTPPFLVAIIWKEATSTTALINTLGRNLHSSVFCHCLLINVLMIKSCLFLLRYAMTSRSCNLSDNQLLATLKTVQ